MPGQKKISESRTGGILAQNIFAAGKTSRRQNFAHCDFKREVFVLSSGECVTATRVVHGERFVLHCRRIGAGRGVRRRSAGMKDSVRSAESFFALRDERIALAGVKE